LPTKPVITKKVARIPRLRSAGNTRLRASSVPVVEVSTTARENVAVLHEIVQGDGAQPRRDEKSSWFSKSS